MLRTLPLFFALLFSAPLFGQSLWTDVAEGAIASRFERRIVPEAYRTVRADMALLQNTLLSAPAGQGVTLTLPAPDGGMDRYTVWERPVMAPDLQARYPEIRCFTGKGPGGALLKCDVTPWGFHAMILTNGQENDYFIDPFQHGDPAHYVVYFKKDFVKKGEDDFACLQEPEQGKVLHLDEKNHAAGAESAGDCQLRKYRLALACTGEYAAFHGGTIPSVLAAMNTTMNRVNGVYENDFAVTMEIIPNNDLLIYLNGGTDPYTNGNGSTMLGQNVTNINAVIGTANYDIGHVFSTGGGGIAGLRVVCTTNKARGVTGGGSPVGDPFDIDYVAHEMGHQFGANHTQNNNCNRVAAAAMEPGSASTIMGYAGICSPNVQNNSDDYFHAISIQEISAFITTGSGNTCPVKTVTGNNAPQVSAGADYIIPRSTPFALTATATDADGDSLSYCWEQMDPEPANMPPVSTNTGGPLFRSYKAVPSPTRYFPRLPDLVNNINSTWEELPGVARSLKFRVTVRDNFAGAGCTDEDDLVLSVAGNAGPFVVTAPNTNVTWLVGEFRQVTWDVANTDAAPVACAEVQILLSTDGGFTYPVVLANNVPNNGTAMITVPNNISQTCRIMVRGVGNVFFDISNENFAIEIPPAPTFVATASVSKASVCAGESLSFTLDVNAIAGFDETLDISVSGQPAGAQVTITPDTLTPSGQAEVTLGGFTSPMSGDYVLSVVIQGASVTRTLEIELTVFPGAPDAMVQAISPADSASGVSPVATLVWSPVVYAETYELLVATNPSFDPGSIVFSTVTPDSFAVAPDLVPETVYYWRVQAANLCGKGDVSPFKAFQVGAGDCSFEYSSADVPVAISASSINTISSEIEVDDTGIVVDVDVHMEADHTWVGDLDAVLFSPSGDSIVLFSRPGVPSDQFGCNGDDLVLTFDDAAANSALDLENSCANAPALTGVYQSVDPMAAFNGQQAQGKWRLQMTDYYQDDGGELTAWRLNFCYLSVPPAALLLTNEALVVVQGASGVIDSSLLQGQYGSTAAETRFVVLQVPAHGSLQRNGTDLAVGAVFTQADLDAGLLGYVHNGNTETSDRFLFDYQDVSTGAWIHNAQFDINILQNTLAASVAVDQEILCFGGTDGQISVAVNGGYPPFAYSLDGVNFQASGVFPDLGAGTYTIVVRDAQGFTIEAAPVQLSDGPQILVNGMVMGDDILVVATGGAGTLEYSINGVDFQSDSTFLDLPNATYTITVRDENGCTATDEVVVAVGVLLASLEVVNNVSCNLGSDGSVQAQVFGGIMPYSYSINGVDFQSSNTFAGLAAGTYAVLVMDGDGAIVQTNTVVISEPAPITVNSAVALNVITVTAFGGTGVLEYSINGVDFQSSNVFTVLASGLYQVYVRDENGCVETTEVLVDIPALLITVVNTTGDILCFGGTTDLVVSAEGGIPPYEYRLDNGAFQMSNVLAGVGAGAHTVTIRDAAGTEYDAMITLIEPDEIMADITVTGNDVTDLTFSGGQPPYTFVTGPGLPSDLMDIPNGTYSITVTDEFGCTKEISFTINYTVVSATAAGTPPSCHGDADGQIAVTAANGTPPYEYALDGGAFQMDNTFEGLAAGTYAVTVRDALGDEFVVMVTLAEPDLLTVDAETASDSILAQASGGAQPWEYSINGTDYQASPVFANVPNGIYTVYVRDANGCLAEIPDVVVDFIGTVDLVREWGLAVMPNPGRGLFRIRMATAPSGPIHLSVSDMLGRVLHQAEWVGNGQPMDEALDLFHLPQGNYLLQLRTAEVRGGLLLQIVR